MALGPEQIEEHAENAYKLFADQTNTSAPWETLPNKHIWRDLVTTWEREPMAKPANLMEESVALVFQITADVEKMKAAEVLPVEPPPEVQAAAAEPPVPEPPSVDPQKKGKK